MTPPALRGTTWMGMRRRMRTPGGPVTPKNRPPPARDATGTRKGGHHLPASGLGRQEAPLAVVDQEGLGAGGMVSM